MKKLIVTFLLLSSYFLVSSAQNSPIVLSPTLPAGTGASKTFFKQYSKALSDALGGLGDINNELNQVGGQIENAENAIGDGARRLATVQDENAALKKEFDDATNNLKALQSHEDKMKTDHDALQKQLASLGMQLDANRRRQGEVNDKIEQIQRSLKENGAEAKKDQELQDKQKELLHRLINERDNLLKKQQEQEAIIDLIKKAIQGQTSNAMRGMQKAILSGKRPYKAYIPPKGAKKVVVIDYDCPPKSPSEDSACNAETKSDSSIAVSAA